MLPMNLSFTAGTIAMRPTLEGRPSADRRPRSVDMALSAGEDFRRPVTLALSGLALIGWLLAGYLWSEASRTEARRARAIITHLRSEK